MVKRDVGRLAQTEPGTPSAPFLRSSGNAEPGPRPNERRNFLTARSKLQTLGI